ncbi:hypothetical protein ACFY04_00900 [Streptomyces sp. NPDC001549]
MTWSTAPAAEQVGAAGSAHLLGAPAAHRARPAADLGFTMAGRRADGLPG